MPLGDEGADAQSNADPAVAATVMSSGARSACESGDVDSFETAIGAAPGDVSMLFCEALSSTHAVRRNRRRVTRILVCHAHDAHGYAQCLASCSMLKGSQRPQTRQSCLVSCLARRHRFADGGGESRRLLVLPAQFQRLPRSGAACCVTSTCSSSVTACIARLSIPCCLHTTSKL